MAKQTIISLVDDVDGGEATQTIRFGLDGKHFEIDVNDENAEALRASLARYLDAARKVVLARAKRPSSPVSYDSKAVRAWAHSNGIEVAPQGRISGAVLEQYFAAGN